MANNLSGLRSTVFIGVGSNLENPIQQVQRAFRELDEIADCRLLGISSLYESAPIVGKGDVEQAGQPAYINAVAKIETSLSPQQLMQRLLNIEARHQRIRMEKNGPRTLDLDILFFDQLSIETTELSIPHPRAHERAFVLHPLIEIAPDFHIPGKGFAREFLPGVAEQRIRVLQDVQP